MFKRLSMVAVIFTTSPMLLAQQTATLPDAYQAYKSCIGHGLKHHVMDVIKLQPLEKLRQTTLTEVDKCAYLLPKEAQAQKELVESTIFIMSQPTPLSGVSKGPASASIGTLIQSKTGASLLLES